LEPSQIFKKIVDRPGISAADLAFMVYQKRHNSRFFDYLPKLEGAGYLVYSDGNKIYPYKNMNTGETYGEL
jgi:hypothetical protein